jgi:hypothetical protein
MSVIQALRYPFQANEGRTLLILTLLQLLPVVGQVLLIGYGFAVARSLHARQTTLPAFQPMTALMDGLRFVIAGLLYVAPMLVIVPVILTVGVNRGDDTASTGFGNFLGIGVSIVFAMGVAPALKKLPIRSAKVKNAIIGLMFLIPLASVVFTFSRLAATPIAVPTSLADLNTLGIILLCLLGVLGFVVLIGLMVGGVRQAIEGKGLFDPTGNLRLLGQQRGLVLSLVGNWLLLVVVGIVSIGIGSLLILPGLFALVIWASASWHLFTTFYLQAQGDAPKVGTAKQAFAN